MAERFIFDVGQENDGQQKLRGFLDDVSREIVIYSDFPFEELYRIPSNSMIDSDIAAIQAEMTSSSINKFKELIYTNSVLTQVNIWSTPQK